MKHRIIYNLLLAVLLFILAVGWLLSGFSVGVQMTPNPTAQLEQDIASALIILSIIGLVIVNVGARRRKSASTSTNVKIIKPQPK